MPTGRGAAAHLARGYGQRWSIETAFCAITTTLACAIKTLAYPQAALFPLCLALWADNAVSLIKAALRSAHGRKKLNDAVSSYALSLAIGRPYDGRMMAIPAPHGAFFRALSVRAFAEALRELASSVQRSRYQKHPRGPQKKPPERAPYQHGEHVATARLMREDDHVERAGAYGADGLGKKNLKLAQGPAEYILGLSRVQGLTEIKMAGVEVGWRQAMLRRDD